MLAISGLYVDDCEQLARSYYQSMFILSRSYLAGLSDLRETYYQPSWVEAVILLIFMCIFKSLICRYLVIPNSLSIKKECSGGN
jgi:hypothetical protein